MNLTRDKYIIVEIIPTSSKANTGFIAQISALKIDGLKLIDRFDYRVDDNLLKNNDIKKLISYDNNMFNYVNNTYFIKEKFKSWSNNYPLLLIEDTYTIDFLKDLDNSKELVYKYLNMEYTLDIFDRIIKKYNLVPSNHLVDLIYEALIYETNT